MRNVLSNVPDDWQDLGLGCITGDVDLGQRERVPNRVFFKVIDWPGGRAFREQFGLPPKDFHITVGFQHMDMFHLRKDESTLVQHRPPLRGAGEPRGWWTIDTAGW